MTAHHAGCYNVTYWVLRDIDLVSTRSGKLMLMSTINGPTEVYYAYEDTINKIQSISRGITYENSWIAVVKRQYQVSVHCDDIVVTYDLCSEKCCRTLREDPLISADQTYSLTTYPLLCHPTTRYTIIGGVVVIFYPNDPQLNNRNIYTPTSGRVNDSISYRT